MARDAPPELTVHAELEGVRYALEEELGAGATSDVWRATRHGIAQPLVLKIGKDPAHASALAAEALVASLALSPRLPELVSLGTLTVAGNVATTSSTGLPYVAFRDMGTSSLDGQAFERSPELALAVARDIAEALADLHGVGLAHGDVKPQNVTWARDRAGLIDLGLAGPAHRAEVGGATPRYLARGDRRLGDALARDLLALGLLIAELASERVARHADPLSCARSTKLHPAVAPLCTALLSPEPGSRPSARWVQDQARAALGEPSAEGSGERDARRVRAAYLKLRRWALGRSREAAPQTATWAAASLAHHDAARAMCAAAGVAPPHPLSSKPGGVLEPLPLLERQRWLVALVGSAAASWPADTIAHPEESELARTLQDLAGSLRPEIWTLRDLEAALADERRTPPSRPPAVGPIDVAHAAELGLRLQRVPVDWPAVEAVEARAADMPTELTLAAADSLRLAGQLGRARSLLSRTTLTGDRGIDLVAEILRRCGDTTGAVDAATIAIDRSVDPIGRARACLARIHYQNGELAQAAKLLGKHPMHALTAEVAALVAAARGERAAAIAFAHRGYALAHAAETRARLSATMAFIERGTHAEEACRRYRAAAEHAVRAGAVLEEASYRTGEAATAVDVGALAAAVRAAERAALLWEEVLGQPAMAARAWLARAAAFAAVDLAHEARYAAEHAISRAVESGDGRAEAYAWWAISDVAEAGSEGGEAAALRARDLVAAGNDPSDRIQAAARVLRHKPSELDDAARARLDDACRHASPTPAAAEARLAWWASRAQALLAAGVRSEDHEAGRRIVSELCALADAPAPVEAVGRSMYAGTLLAAALSESDALARLEASRQRSAERVRRGAGDELAEAARAASWLVGRRESPSLDPAHAIDLRQLVLALSERDSLRKLLDRVLDVLIMWTGAERGLLLMMTPQGELKVEAARNLGRSDLDEEQLLLSQSLAQRALDSAEPVVAIDAMEELSSSYDSVHALRLRSVLALPLIAHGEVLGVVYLDDRLRRGAFGDKELAWAQSVAPVAALAIADARAQVDLKRAAETAQQASRKLETALAHKETALDVAERELARTMHGDATRFRHDDIVGESQVMAKLLRLTDRVASSDVPVLLLGESGSGKELIARALHRGSPRRANAFVGENCGALPETLLESTLFGHAKGAFTGAHRPRIGLFEAADEGTLFLDEIGEMSLAMQTKLLRVLEDNLVRPVGSTRARKVDVRVIAATHRDLEAMVADGSFRQDLYYRLNVISIRIPALRERPEDIPLLVEHLIHKHAPGREVAVTEAAYLRLGRHEWPGNVRQLENEVRRALLLADDTIDVSHLSITSVDTPRSELGLNVRARIDHLEVQLVTDALERTGGNQTQAAKLLGVSRYGLHKMMKRLGIAAKRKRRSPGA